MNFYLGSCRYMYAFGWKYFPARLHTTKEMIYFLENNTNIKDLKSTSIDLADKQSEPNVYTCKPNING